MTLLDDLGFTIHPEKSILTPGHTLVYLGFLLNSMDMTVTLTEDRITRVQKICDDMLKAKLVTIRQLAEIVGTLVALEPGADFAPLHYRRADIYKAHVLRVHGGEFDSKVPLDANTREDITWWRENAQHVTK